MVLLLKLLVSKIVLCVLIFGFVIRDYRKSWFCTQATFRQWFKLCLLRLRGDNFVGCSQRMDPLTPTFKPHPVLKHSPSFSCSCWSYSFDLFTFTQRKRPTMSKLLSRKTQCFSRHLTTFLIFDDFSMNTIQVFHDMWEPRTVEE